MGNPRGEASDRFEFVRLDEVHPCGVEFGVGSDQRSGASRDPRFEFALEPLERRQDLNHNTVHQREHRSIPVGHERVPVGGVQRQIAHEPCGGAQHRNEPPVRTACVPSGDGHRRQVK